MMCFLYTSLLLLKNRFAIRLSRTVCQLSLWRPHPFQVGTMYRTVNIRVTDPYLLNPDSAKILFPDPEDP